jgi:2-keto-4-pentenoate hydratase/2-oxohepta-3-ene-1,7-dioic acid hydratase in catechol pathway
VAEPRIRYRLAVADHGGARSVFVESGGRLFRLADRLDPAALARLGGPPDDLMPFLADWAHWQRVLPGLVPAEGEPGIDPAEVRFRPPVARPNKLICIGANYWDHIAEMKIPMRPDYPYSFVKPASNTLRGSGDAVELPAESKMVDWEAELAVVIGRAARHQPVETALDIVAGYANLNDVSARDWIATAPNVGIDWVRHKAFDGFAPFGPYLLPAEFVPDPQALAITLSVNGVVKQASNTSQMIFGVAPIIAHLSSILTLEPGDVIATGTPAGAGFGRSPREFLAAGDEIRMEVEGLGELVTRMVASPAQPGRS